MKIGVLSDAHGNRIGLQSCLDHLLTEENVDQIYFLGDAVGYFPDADGVISLLQKHQVRSLKGNHDAMLLGQLPLDEEKDQAYHLAETREKISPASLNYLSALSPKLEIEHGSKKVLMVHASPFDPLLGYVYEHDDLEEILKLEYDIILMGHTHRPFIRNEKGKTIINVGSCGLPRDIGNLASVAILDLENEEYRIQRIEMDPDQIIAAYPGIHASVKSCLNRKV